MKQNLKRKEDSNSVKRVRRKNKLDDVQKKTLKIEEEIATIKLFHEKLCFFLP